MTLTARGHDNIVGSFRGSISSIRLYEGNRLIVQFALPSYEALAVGSGAPDRFDALNKNTVLYKGRVGLEMVLDHSYIEAGARVVLKRFEILLDGFAATGKSN